MDVFLAASMKLTVFESHLAALPKSLGQILC